MNNSNSENNTPEIKDDELLEPLIKNPSIIPYIVIFIFLFIVLLIALTWLLDMYYKSRQCATDPSIWCWNDFVCTEKSCDKGNKCFENIESQGLPECLFGPSSFLATNCLPKNDGSTGASCPCNDHLKSINNCLSGCPSSLSDLAPGGMCACTNISNNACNVTT